MKVGDLLKNTIVITDKTGKQRTIELPHFGQVTIQMQNGKIIYIDKLDKENSDRKRRNVSLIAYVPFSLSERRTTWDTLKYYTIQKAIYQVKKKQSVWTLEKNCSSSNH